MQLLSMLHYPPDILFEITKITRIMKFEINKIIIIVAISIPIMLKNSWWLCMFIHSLWRQVTITVFANLTQMCLLHKGTCNNNIIKCHI